MNWTIGEVIEHVKDIEGISNTNDDALLLKFANIFQKQFVENVNYNTFLTSGSVTTYDGRYFYDLGYDFVRPLAEATAFVNGEKVLYNFSRIETHFDQQGGNEENPNQTIYLYKGEPYVYFSALVGQAKSANTIDYYYFRYAPYLSATSQYPLAPVRALTRGLQMMYREANREIPTNLLDQYLYQLFMQYNNTEAKLDQVASAYLYTENRVAYDITDPFTRS